MRKYIYLSLIFLTACPALQSRNDIRTKDGRLGGAQATVETQEAKEVATEQELLAQIREMNGRLEELSFKVRKLEEQGQSNAIENRLDNIEKRILTYGESLILLERKIGASQSVRTSSPTTNVSSKKSSPYDIGESYFKKSDWKAAILEYNKYRDQFPKGKKYADATYKIGVCFQEMGMKSEAKAFYSEIIEKFPKSKSAKSAKYRLNQLKK